MGGLDITSQPCAAVCSRSGSVHPGRRGLDPGLSNGHQRGRGRARSQHGPGRRGLQHILGEEERQVVGRESSVSSRMESSGLPPFSFWVKLNCRI